MPINQNQKTYTREDWVAFIDWGIEKGYWKSEWELSELLGYDRRSLYEGTIRNGPGKAQEGFMRLMALTNDYTLPNP